MTEIRETSNAAWMHTILIEVAEAYRAGRTGDLARVLDRAEQQGPGWKRRIENVLGRLDEMKAGKGGNYNLGFGEPGGASCDWCLADETVCYYPFTAFVIEAYANHHTGDRFYTCAKCRDFIEADDWRGLAAWVGPTARDEMTRILWWGFRCNRTTDGPVAWDGQPERRDE